LSPAPDGGKAGNWILICSYFIELFLVLDGTGVTPRDHQCAHGQSQIIKDHQKVPPRDREAALVLA